MTNTKDVILALKQVKEEKDLSLDKILIIMEEHGQFISKSTLSRVFAKGSEDKLFRYETTLRPIANALLDIETIETDDSLDTQAMKSILKLKKEIIDELQTEREKEKKKYHEKLAKETKHFQDSLDFMTKQIKLKDDRITQLLDANLALQGKLLNCHSCTKGDKQ